MPMVVLIREISNMARSQVLDPLNLNFKVMKDNIKATKNKEKGFIRTLNM